eukprot:c2844_g2_i1 orf=81-362(-)
MIARKSKLKMKAYKKEGNRQERWVFGFAHKVTKSNFTLLQFSLEPNIRCWHSILLMFRSSPGSPSLPCLPHLCSIICFNSDQKKFPPPFLRKR